ncbi:DMT family transporter [Canibacter oris]|uniref:Drug/metabolite transporter (DMT)-like permease n=1 Tax=Canibacter oris TaxID=1365628 RepID=A0A840DDM6_9MICO|nr:DMT family transporter [Canibacter oris]MBB4071551.1 drug/metabolite transporter (DMT)-like permease [Canibacter oris]
MRAALLWYLLFPGVFAAVVFAQDVDPLHLTGKQLLGIAVAICGAVLMSVGTQYQSRGLNKVEQLTQESAATGLSGAHVKRLMSRPSWLSGSLMLALAVCLQIVALSLAPLVVVQPLGVVALVVTAVLNAKMSGIRLPKRVRSAILLCVIGVVVFVTVAAFTARDVRVKDQQLITILAIFAGSVLLLIAAISLLRKKPNPLVYVIGAGILYAFVATLAKTVISRFQQGDVEVLTWIAVACLILGAALGMIYVQNAHSCGPPDLVIAGLTVIDPLVAVLIGILVLGEASSAPWWAFVMFVISGAVALFGVLTISKFHPQVGKNSLEIT